MCLKIWNMEIDKEQRISISISRKSKLTAQKHNEILVGLPPLLPYLTLKIPQMANATCKGNLEQMKCQTCVFTT